jgi:translocator protein
MVRKILQIILFIAIAQAAGLIGTYFTFDAIPTWYASLTKPSFSPPNWVFGPVWTVLYTLMGVAASFAWDKRHSKTNAARGMKWYWTQLALNALWSPIFFGWQRMDIALVVIVLMWVAIIFTIREFWKVRPWLGIALLPYLAWVSFATVLNFTLWQLNK